MTKPATVGSFDDEDKVQCPLMAKSGHQVNDPPCQRRVAGDAFDGKKKRLPRVDSARTTLAATRPNTLVCFTGGDPSLTTRYSGDLPREAGASSAASGAAGGVVRSRAVGGKHGFSGATSRPGGRTGGDSRLVGLNLKTIETAVCRT